MDIISHVIAGAATGAAFGHPVLGAIIAVIPDLPIMGPRVEEPPKLYMISHSLIFLLSASLFFAFFGIGWLVFFCLASHLVLDLPTHGYQWSPRLMYPSRYPIYWLEEWEFFNSSWLLGLLITILWSSVWILISL